MLCSGHVSAFTVNMTIQLREVKFVPLIFLVEHLHAVGDGVLGWNGVGPKLDEILDLSRTVRKVF